MAYRVANGDGGAERVNGYAKSLKRKLQIIAHRGANSVLPENSLPAFEKAITLGCDGIEVDLRMTADREIVVFHDRRMGRMTGQDGRIEQMTLADIRNRRLSGSNDVKIPTLREVLDLAKDKCLINLDIKTAAIHKTGFEALILSQLEEFGLRDNIIFASFNPLVVRRFHALAPDIKIGFIYLERRHRWISLGIPLDSLHINYKRLSKSYIQHFQNRGIKLYAWTVDEAAAMKNVAGVGVDGIITNCPENYYDPANGLV